MSVDGAATPAASRISASESSICLRMASLSFVSQLSNGGAGRYYGLFPLAYSDAAGGHLERWEEGDGFAGNLSTPFPHRTSWGLPEARFERPESFESEEEEAWYSALDDEMWRPELVDGAFPIGHQGCVNQNLLVVSGLERGNIEGDDRPNDSGVHSGTSLFDWSWHWLDKSIATLMRST